MVRKSRRRVLGYIGIGSAVGLAGCIGSDNGEGGTNGDPDTDEGDDEDTLDPTQDSIGSAGETIDGFEVVGWNHRIDGSADDRESLWVKVWVENAGDQTTDFGKYPIKIQPYDEDGEELIYLGGSQTPEGDSELAPGEIGVADVDVILAEETPPSQMATYDVIVECDAYGNGVYCDE